MNKILRVALGTALVLLVPLIAMLFTDEVQWNWFDFLVIGTLLVSAGLTYEFVVKRVKDNTRQTALVIVLIASVLLAWAELAVGLFGSPFAGS